MDRGTLSLISSGGRSSNRLQLRNFRIFASGGSQAIRVDGGLQPWIEACKVVVDDSEPYVVQEANQFRSQMHAWAPAIWIWRVFIYEFMHSCSHS